MSWNITRSSRVQQFELSLVCRIEFLVRKLADLWEVWSKHYEGELEKSDFKTRTQSSDPDVTCMALRRLANYFGRGKKVKVTARTFSSFS